MLKQHQIAVDPALWSHYKRRDSKILQSTIVKPCGDSQTLIGTPMSSRLEHVKDWHAMAMSAGYCVSALAVLAKITTRHLERYFRDKMGNSPHNWLRESRMRRASKLICEGFAAKEVAKMLYYESAAHFTRDFKSYYGVTPRMYALNGSNSAAAEKMSHFVKSFCFH